MTAEPPISSQLDPIFRPQSVAVIGASTEPKALGRQILENLLRYGFRGHLFPVNPKTRELLRAIRGYPVLAGVRGQKPVAFDRLEEALTRLSQLVADFDCIEEIDINPFFASERGADCKAADARLRPAPPR